MNLTEAPTNRAISVREIEKSDIELIADYWLKSDPDFMVSLGVDLKKLPSREGLKDMLTAQICQPYAKKQTYALIWELEGKPVGHSNVNNISFEIEATMHLHLWQSTNRQQGLGTELLKKSLPFYFDKLKLNRLIVEPYALNLAPNRILKKMGFSFIKTYTTIPGSLNFEQKVHRWELTKSEFEDLK